MTETLRARTSVVAALDRVHARRLLQRVGIVEEPPGPIGSDTPEVAQLLSEPWFDERLREAADKLERDHRGVRTEAAGYLREMSAAQDERPMEAWHRFGHWMMRAYDVVVDDDAIAKLRELDRKCTLVVLPSHRSYLDAWVAPHALMGQGISPTFTFGGANLNFFPLGTFASHTGMIFIRRQTADLPVYRIALRAYIGQLVRNRKNLSWSIAGGRTRTGKLRPPMYGILHYVVDAVQAVHGPEVLLVPVSIVYDQLHEVSLMATEARGGAKTPEDLRWLVRLARQQRHRLGRVYLDIGEPLPLRRRLTELRSDDTASGHEIERIAVDVSHRINRATPVTATAVVNLALLGADRALTLAEVLATVRPLADYISKRNWQVAGSANLADGSTIRRTLQELVASGVLTSYDGGTEPVWRIGGEQHLVAAFYRNTAIHMLVDRAIAELALQAAADGDGDAQGTVLEEALRLRELLKFEFFFSARSAFESELAIELRLIGAAVDDTAKACSPADADRLLREADLLLAHLVLRPYLDAYHIVADRLAAHGDDLDEQRFLAECLRVGKQWQLQGRIASAESVSLELYKTALRLARHRDLVDGSDPVLDKQRREFAEQIATTTRRVKQIAELARAAQR